ncbi:ribonuclease P protein subunit p38-like isoform X1 [Pecten maximus]|uniref:ribonuclease P protein subunit p38-like isoform X1 n=1 Tax=Pecten maximus TaxID=6579 RepID=UPI0014589D13|nr:ribonuclease P protein subunit p38-like isoform X1 [Pecten maximus]XP_033760098.1 ribonuclease P protein subunit p38-like isoform X1 [Pecten maximus]
MSAPTLTQKQIQQTIRKGNSKQATKTALSNPYNIQWPTVQDKVQQEILQRLISTLKSLDIARPKSYKRKKKKTEDSKKDSVLPRDEERQAIRKQLLLGVNQVTRGLEKDEVRLVIVCRSAKPVIITQHLIGLASLRRCPAICINDLNKAVGEAMNITSAVAVGFKKISKDADPSVFDDLVEFTTKHTPEITLAWLPESSGDTLKMETRLEEMDTTTKDESRNTLHVEDTSDHSVKNESTNLSCIENSDIRTEPADLDIGEKFFKDSSHNVRSRIKPADQTKMDYSHFYVYKSLATNKEKKWPEFLRFSSEPEESVEYKNMTVQESLKNPQQHSVKYEKVSVQRIPANPDRKKRKRKLKI